MARYNKANSIRLKNLRKDEIITTALRVFAEKGFENTTMQTIANETGISKGLMYHYFSSKNDIVQACLEWAMDDSKNLIDEMEHLPGTSIEKLLYFSRGSLSQERRDSFRIIQRLITVDEKINKRFVEQFNQLITEKLIPVFIEGQNKNEIVDRDPEKIVDLYLTVLSGLLQEQLNWEEEAFNWNIKRLLKIVEY